MAGLLEKVWANGGAPLPPEFEAWLGTQPGLGMRDGPSPNPMFMYAGNRGVDNANTLVSGPGGKAMPSEGNVSYDHSPGSGGLLVLPQGTYGEGWQQRAAQRYGELTAPEQARVQKKGKTEDLTGGGTRSALGGETPPLWYFQNPGRNDQGGYNVRPIQNTSPWNTPLREQAKQWEPVIADIHGSGVKPADPNDNGGFSLGFLGALLGALGGGGAKQPSSGGGGLLDMFGSGGLLSLFGGGGGGGGGGLGDIFAKPQVRAPIPVDNPANIHPDAMKPLSEGRTSYSPSSSPGQLMPTVSMSGKARHSYGD